MKIIALLLSLSLLVVTHELGHFLFARLFKTRVRRFYLFFNWGFSILKAKKFNGKWHFLFFNSTTPDEWDEKNLAPEDRDNTLWGIGWIPLGGYCDIAGMIDETKGTDDLESEPQPWEYRSKKAWQRLCIISGGVLVNFVSALLIYTLIFAHWGESELPLQNASLGYDYHQILLDEGFQNGDIICAIDGKPMDNIVKTQHTLLLDNPKTVSVKRRLSVNDPFFAADSLSDADSLTDDGSQLLADADWRDTVVIVDIALSHDLLTEVDPRDTNMLFVVRAPFVVKDFVAGSQAKRAGMEIGDSVVSVDGVPMSSFSEIAPSLLEHADDTVALGLYRSGEFLTVNVCVDNNGKIGVYLADICQVFDCEHTDYNLFQAIPRGVAYGCEQLVSYVSSLRILFTADGYKGLGGFGTLGGLFPSTWDWYSFWVITAFLAVILAFMNVIPIPGLDGGHILFTLWEIVTRRKPSDKFLEVAQTIGMLLLLALLIVANGNDLLRIFK